MPIIQFAPFSSLINPTFWHTLTQLKIDVLKLSSDSVPITGSYTYGKTVVDRESGKEIALGSNLGLSGESFDAAHTASPHSVTVKGTLKNFNTIEEFKSSDKAALFNALADELWSSDFPEDGNKFLVLTFADLKKYKYYYWCAFPAFVVKPSWEIGEGGWEGVSSGGSFGEEDLRTIASREEPNAPFFLVRRNAGGKIETTPLIASAYPGFFTDVPEKDRYVAFIDPSSLPQNPGWPLRNLLTYLVRHSAPYTSTAASPATTSPKPPSFNIISWRDTDVPSEDGGKGWKSLLGKVYLPSAPDLGKTSAEVEKVVRWNAIGWERDGKGKMSPRLADLGGMMDPRRLADQAVDLNLKLMRWRILPALDLERVSRTKCLLLGAGTLGCYVARVLMGWGIRKITLLDSSRVSFSNPVRQPLFEFEDCLEGGKPKAECAAERLTKIFPGVDAQGITLSIPMPGHPIPANEAIVEKTKADVAKLEALIEEHDVVFLLMDSRESRWLPTLIGAAKNKLVLNAALGFDTYLVMRHGGHTPSTASEEGQGEKKKLGCYFCNDIVAPADSLSDRTLDQMCTVTRPGLASIAAASAVELMVSTLQHPLGIDAPAPPVEIATGKQSSPESGDTSYESVLGIVPHQIRGFLAQWRNMIIKGDAYSRCTGCSDIVINEYRSKGFEMLLRAFNESKYLEELTGLDRLYEEGEKALEDVDWIEEGSEEDF
ncbi:E1-like protein-activating [Sistotremastrum suecicum HHB10207 ss-3]|uniref:Ubiquitin-like modifier-activating enzyme ATG7 n=1 Tax=Sistotremastrum suecicum HHB10207 ss-3 TaxID=1314776 RepID=A0A166DJS6_9AGAM|nr:E1-like protein-activating [Sistotremastrum suecicum HHB10207 ss-3]